MPTDWAASAKEFGGTVAPPPGTTTDWATAAKEFGGTVEAPPARDPRARVGDAVANFAKNFWGEMTQAGQGMVDLATGLYHHPVDTAIDTVKAIGASQDAIRQKAQAAMQRGDYTEAARHAVNYLIPMLGPAIDARGDQAQRGDITGSAGGTLAIAAQALGPQALEAAAPAVVEAAQAASNAARTAATATKGAAKGAGQAVVETQPITIKGQTFHVPVVVAGGAAGGQAASMMGLPKSAGAVVGAGAPIVRGAIRGAREALADRTAALAATVEPSAPPVVNPPRQLPPGPIITPAPADASFVRSVPAEYPPVELTAQEQALAAHILENVEPLPPRLALPPAPPTPPDTSFVRGVPGQYPEVIPPALRTNATAEAAATKLRDMMQESGTAPTPETPPPIVEPIDFAAVGRAEKVDALHNYLTANKIPLAMVDEFGPKEWQMVSKQAGVKPPSAESIKEIRTRLAEYEAASTRPAAAGKMSPEEATADFAARRATRTEAAPGRTEVLPPPKAEPQVRVKSLEEAQRILAERRAQQEAATEASMQREATTRVQRITQYLKDQGFSSKAIHNFGPGDWKMVGHAAEGLPPTAQEIAAIKQATVVR